MKKISLFLAAAIVVSIGLLSCGEGRYYSQSYPRSSFSLIISPRPGMGISRYNDGRYYYRSPEGYMYWRGNDDRYYLDRSYLNRGHYEQREYNEWRNHGGRDNDGRHQRRRR